MQIREGTLDDFVVKEQSGYRGLFSRTDKNAEGTVLDIGANIGAFSAHYAPKFPNMKFMGYEPEAENFQMSLDNNVDNANVTMIHAAVAKEDGLLSLYVNDKKNKGLHTLIPVRGRSVQTKIRAIKFQRILDKHKPKLIKMDIEGGEYFLMDELMNLPSYVESIAIELHLTKREYKQFGWDLDKSLSEQFPNIIKGGNLHTKPLTYGGWTAMFIGHR